MKKIIVLMLCMIMFTGLVFSNGQQDADLAGGAEKDQPIVAFVPKIMNQAWFERMYVGIQQWSEDNGIDVIYKGPSEVDSAAQVQIVSDLIAQQVDIICIVPLDPTACESILKKALDQGIIVISHEASSLQNNTYNLEAFKAADYGAFIMDNLAEMMDEEGDYVTMVGTLTQVSHMDWADGGVARQKEAYPKMHLIDADKRVESQLDAEVAYQVAKELIKKYPNLKGIMGTSSFDAMGCARAIKELGKKGKVFAAGSGLPSENEALLKEGVLKKVALWDPYSAGYAMLTLALDVFEGKTIATGIDLGLEGYDNMTLEGKQLIGQGWISITAENVDSFGF